MQNNKVKNILFVEQNQDGTIGGSHHSLFYLINSIDRKKYRPKVIFYEKNQLYGTFENICDCYLYEKPLGKHFLKNIGTLQYLYVAINKAINFLRTSIIPFLTFCQFIHKEKIELVHLNNSSYAGWEWLIASKIIGIKCVTHQRGPVKFNSLNKFMANQFDAIICISEYIKNNLNKHGVTNNITTILNAIDIIDFKSKVVKDKVLVREGFNIDIDNYLLGMVGNFQEWKGQLSVVKAINILKIKYPNIRCLLIGGVSDKYKKDKEYLDQVIELISKFNLEKHVIITGYRSDVPELINACDVIIHSSIEPEPFGRVIIEGMCLKKPVIATGIGGAKEIIEDNISGILIEPNDHVKLAEKINTLLQDIDMRKRIEEEAFKRVEKDFSIDTFALKINTFYSNLFSE